MTGKERMAAVAEYTSELRLESCKGLIDQKKADRNGVVMLKVPVCLFRLRISQIRL